MEIIVIILVILFIVYLLLSRPESLEEKGLSGETNVAAVVGAELQKGLYGHVFRSVYVPRDDGRTSEIDVILICVKGIFVIESKNFAGYVFGNENNRNWTLSAPERNSVSSAEARKAAQLSHLPWQDSDW